MDRVNSAVSTLDGRSRKKNNKRFTALHRLLYFIIIVNTKKKQSQIDVLISISIDLPLYKINMKLKRSS